MRRARARHLLRWAVVGAVSRQLMGEVTRVRSNFVNGIKKFPVRVHLLTPEVEH